MVSLMLREQLPWKTVQCLYPELHLFVTGTHRHTHLYIYIYVQTVSKSDQSTDTDWGETNIKIRSHTDLQGGYTVYYLKKNNLIR